MPDRLQKPSEPETFKKEQDETGPQKPEVERPDRKNLLERMKRVDPDSARKYRQRSGE